MPTPTYPPRLRPNDLVAISAPAGAASRPGSVEQATRNLEALGLRVKLMPNVMARWGYLAGTDEERAADVNSALGDPDIRALITLRGGYGTMRILPLLDYDLLRRDPKIVIGYSDITGLLNALTRKTEVVTFHGPIAEAKFAGFEGEAFRRACWEGQQLADVSDMVPQSKISPPRSTIRSGSATGRLIGGNLSLIAPIAGTPYGPDFDGAILFLEDINEAPYRVDRMLTGLWLGGHLQKLGGIVFGDFRESEPDTDFTMREVFDNLRRWVDIPMFCGLPAGHIADKLTLPIGARVTLDADRCALTW